MMRKTIGFLIGFLASVLSVPVGAVGTIPGISFSQILDTTGVPLGGGLLYLIQAGTTSTPQNCFQDTGLTIPYPNPVTLDAYGRVPQLFCADGQIKVRITDKNGVQKLVQDNLLIIGASSGGGGGGSVDPTTILTTGDFKMQYGTGPINGFVRCNGRTIGSATSGATERSNADTSALYSFLWGNDPNLVVTGGRGASAAADFAANKPMALPDCRGRSLTGLADMGNSATGIFTSTYANCTPTTLGAGCGQQSWTLTLAQLATGIASNNAAQLITVYPGGNSSLDVSTNTNAPTNTVVNGGGTSFNVPAQGSQSWGFVNSFSANNSIAVVSNNTGGQPHPTVGPSILVTTYIKL